MRLPQVRLESQMAKIQIQSTPAVQTIQQPKALQSIEQPHATVTMSTTPGKLTIDQTKAWEDMNLYGPLRAAEKEGMRGKQAVLEGISRRAQQGQELMKIENKGNPIVNQAIVNGHKPMKQFNIGWIPSLFSVKTHYTPSELDVNVKAKSPIINHEPQSPIVEFHSGSVETSLQQEASLDVDFVNVNWK
ncbi:DUF6470 family protein [Radiobacillus deserti]|uniref:YviE n=1 Tax=Radiobacillus deserti TaxID=2594883 RepID=A0A516KIS7_9BACI|nr:DUF6470 family protein [Radiobacillus deserti]QDP41281.1 hypothetical protein FN924_14460 [Radiobacillus deserti]